MSNRKYILINAGKVWIEVGEEEQWQLPKQLPCDMKCEDQSEWFELTSDCVVPVMSGTEVPRDSDAGRWMGVRDSWQMLSADDYALVGKGAELLFWRRNNLYCGRCGKPTERNSEISRICSDCGYEIFPSPSPAVLVLVIHNEKALLVHARTFTRPFFGLVAGFVETGESLEECVAREVKEETSLEIENILYFGSQAWPYPFNLMIGFTATYKGGEISFDDNELSEGAFFDRNNLPLLPTMPSLARQMIDAWINEK